MARVVDLGTGREGDHVAYHLPERGVVVDPGPPTSDAWDRLVAALGDAQQRTLADVEHVLVTHWHVDHAGLAPRLAERADATLHMHERDASLVGDYAVARERRVARDRQRLREWGIPPQVRSVLVEADSPAPLPDSFPVDELGDGDEVAGLTLRATPGHTLGHSAFHGDGILFVGDLVLPDYTPNVGGGDTRMAHPLAMYRESLARVEGVDGKAYPGHGTALALDERIATIREHHRQRSDRVLDVVDSTAPVTPWMVAEELFGDMSGYHVKMGAGEAASHLLALARAGQVTVVGEDPLRYATNE